MDKSLDALAYRNKGHARLASKDYKNAAVFYSRSARMNRYDSLTTNDLGYTLQQLKKYDIAISHFKAAINLDQTNIRAYGNWLTILCEQGKLKEGLKISEECALANPLNGDAYNNWGCLESLGKHEEAVTKFMKAVELNPREYQAYLNWGVALRRQGKYEKSLEKMQKVLTLKPDHVDAYNNCGVILYDMMRYEEAIDIFKRALNINPSYINSYINLGLALHQKGNHADSKKMFLKGIELAVASNIKGKLQTGLMKEIDEAGKKLQKSSSDTVIRHYKESIQGIKNILNLLSRNLTKIEESAK